MRRRLAEVGAVKLCRKFLGLHDGRGADGGARASHDAAAPGAADAEDDTVALELVARCLEIVDMDEGDLHCLARSEVNLAASVSMRYAGNDAQLFGVQVAAHGPQPDEEGVLLVLRDDPDALEARQYSHFFLRSVHSCFFPGRWMINLERRHGTRIGGLSRASASSSIRGYIASPMPGHKWPKTAYFLLTGPTV